MACSRSGQYRRRENQTKWGCYRSRRLTRFLITDVQMSNGGPRGENYTYTPVENKQKVMVSVCGSRLFLDRGRIGFVSLRSGEPTTHRGLDLPNLLREFEDAIFMRRGTASNPGTH